MSAVAEVLSTVVHHRDPRCSDLPTCPVCADSMVAAEASADCGPCACPAVAAGAAACACAALGATPIPSPTAIANIGAIRFDRIVITS